MIISLTNDIISSFLRLKNSVQRTPNIFKRKAYGLSHMLFMSSLLLLSSTAFSGASECEVVEALGIKSKFICEKALGVVLHSNGTVAGNKGGSWFYSNGAFAGTVSSNWTHANSRIAGVPGGTWFHSNGRLAGSMGSAWFYDNGQPAGSGTSGGWMNSKGTNLIQFTQLSEGEILQIVFKKALD